MKPEFQKLPPQSIESEEALLSAAMLGCAQDVVELLEPEDFYRTAHQKIFQAICELVSLKQVADLATVVNHLREKNQLEEIGGASFIARLIDVIPSAANPKEYARIIKSHSLKRQVIKICSETVQSCYNGQKVDDIMAKHDTELSKITLHGGSFVKLGDIIPGLLEKWEETTKNPGPQGILCGLTEIDRKFGGFQGATLYVVAARPGMGKTAWGMRVARGAARNGHPVAQISLEMSKEQLLTREVSCGAGIDGERFLTGDLTNQHWKKITDSVIEIEPMPIWVDDSPRATIKECQSKMRQFHIKHGRCLYLFDYLDYITGHSSDRKDLEIGTITKGLKASAKELNVPIILFVQLNRACEDRPDKRPQIRDLRNSGEIEQDADVIAFIYRDEVYNPNTEYQGIAEFIIRKHRNGKPETVYLTWIAHRTTFENLVRNINKNKD